MNSKDIQKGHRPGPPPQNWTEADAQAEADRRMAEQRKTGYKWLASTAAAAGLYLLNRGIFKNFDEKFHR